VTRREYPHGAHRIAKMGMYDVDGGELNVDNPKVTIVIPCYKGEKYLAAAIDSVLEQTLATLEIVVVDDCSPDRSAEIAKEYGCRDSRVRLIPRESNGGVARAWNTGFSAARGRYFLRLAQDDWLMPDAVDTLAGFLDAHPEVGLTYAPMDIVAEDGKLLVTYMTPEESPLLPSNKMGLCAMWRREVWDAVGTFDSKCDFAEDYDYWLRVCLKCRMARCTDRPLLNFRHHGQQNSATGEKRQQIATRRALVKHAWMRARRAPYRAGRWWSALRATAAWLGE